MKSIQQQWVHGALLLCLCHRAALAFQPQSNSRLSSRKNGVHQAMVDPNDIMTSLVHHHDPETLPALLSTMLSTAIQPAAHGHSNPIFGPPDQLLEAGKSIAPSAKALTNMGVTHAKSVQEMIPDTSEGFQNAVKEVLMKGKKVLDINDLTIRGGDPLPGFEVTKGILPTRTPPPESLQSFASEVKWSAGYFNVMDKLPYVAFWYAMVEFFILRPNVDLYKEDIEADPVGVSIDTISVTAVRAVALAIISFVTVGFFG